MGDSEYSELTINFVKCELGIVNLISSHIITKRRKSDTGSVEASIDTWSIPLLFLGKQNLLLILGV